MTAPASSNDDIPVQPGSILAGKYRVMRVLGKGGMGVVVEARHVALDERVALKFLLPEYAQHPEAAARFLREGQAAVKIKGEHVARVSDVGTLESGSPFMVMEFLEGIDLSNALQKYGVCQIPDAIDYVLQASEAIAEAHTLGIIHRDLKPANMFLTRRPDGTPMIKVLDFGISKMQGGGVDNLTRTTATMGSALYMSPEQMQTTRGVDHRTDIYALGISLYELLAGKQPYYADTLPQLCAEVLTGTPTPIRTLRGDVAEGLAFALEKAYARDRDQRYQTIAEFAAGLAPFAPARSQTSLDRIARMAGVAPSPAGRAATPSHPDLSHLAPQAAHPGFQTGSQNAAPQAISNTGNLAQTGGSSAPVGAQTGGVVGPAPMAIGGYQGPMSTKAAAAFAAGASTNANLSSTSGALSPAPKKTGVLFAVGLVVVLLAGGAVAVWRLKGPSGDVSPAEAPTSTAAPPTATAAITAPPSASPAPTAEPAPTASASAEPTSTATAAVSAPPPTPTGTAKLKPGPKPTATVTATKKPGVMTSR
ncbi:MAG: protein kinase [Polyangiaceae bacterium]|nr:protein kinase [Polyangiaceae bacterium]